QYGGLMKRWELQFLLLKSVHMIDITQDQVIRITAATEVVVIMVVIEICAVIENSEVIIVVVDMVEIGLEVIPSRRNKISYLSLGENLAM
ncbi:MAG: hypothetical protein WCF23_01420, partial [Candidatus Nitrosopolaris sp.]